MSIFERPWGFFCNLRRAAGYQVKYLHIKPFNRLSLQYHNHREEYWLIINGKAQIINDNKELELTCGQSLYIPQKSIHRVANCTTEPLEILELQIGTILEEEDIVRLNDDYGRI